MRIFDSNTESVEEIDIAKDRIVDVKIGYEFIIITALSQCYIYNISNLNTPIIFELKAATQFIHVSNNRYFLLCDYLQGLSVYSYEGKFCCSPKFPNFRPELYTKDYVALSNDVVAIVDCIDSKNIFLFDSATGRNYGKLTHSAEVTKVYLNQSNHAAHERILAFVDKSFDLYIAHVNTAAISHGAGGATSLNNSVSMHKLQPHVESCLFHDTNNVLACMSDNTFVVFYHPEVVFVNKDLLQYSKQAVETADYGRSAQLVSYAGNRVNVRKIDGSIVYANTNVDVLLLDELMYAGRWEESTRLCRHQHSPVLWACMAAMAINKKQLEAAELSLAELKEVAKVEYIQYIKSIPSEEGRNAELLVFKKQYDEAERVLLQASPPLIYRLIKLNIALFRFHRALDFANRYKQFVDVVLYYRRKHLDGFGRDEHDAKFLAVMNQMSVNEADVLRKEQEEVEEEASRYGGGRSSYRK
ncbi:hypothetical protein EON64_12165 [archaeon]|nr:MAG: hypothetical protein EON64_12165 [archaeon]